MISRLFKIELYWFLALIVLALGMSFLVPKTLHASSIPGVSLTVMDTYFSLNFLWFFFSFYTGYGTLVNVVRGTVSRFKAIPLNLHLIFSLSMFTILIISSEETIYELYYSVLNNQGLTVYPTLSALSPKPVDPFPWLIIVKFILVAAIFLLGLKTGKLLDKTSTEIPEDIKD